MSDALARRPGCCINSVIPHTYTLAWLFHSLLGIIEMYSPCIFCSLSREKTERLVAERNCSGLRQSTRRNVPFSDPSPMPHTGRPVKCEKASQQKRKTASKVGHPAAEGRQGGEQQQQVAAAATATVPGSKAAPAKTFFSPSMCICDSGSQLQIPDRTPGLLPTTTTTRK
jgi:hypothetical protein